MAHYRHLKAKIMDDFVKGFVSITIVNWNSRGYIERCLDSIRNQTYPYFEVIVIDNNSVDESLEYIINNFPNIKVIKNKKNLGFSKAHNQGIYLSKGEYVLPLNFDVFLEPNFIAEMVEVMKGAPDIGLISGKLYKQINGNKSALIDSTGIMMKYCFMRPRGEAEEDKGQYDRPEDRIMFGACGAAPFYRRAMLEDIKFSNEFFDEDFINYVEDVDLSWRALLRGWKCLYNPKAVAYHERGATRKNNGSMQSGYLLYGLRNRYCSLIKNITRGYWKKNKLKIIANELRFLLASIESMPRVIRLKSFYLALGMAKKMLIKRAIIQQRKVISDDYLDYFLCYSRFDLGKAALKIKNALSDGD